MRRLVEEREVLLPDHPWLLAHEWEVKPGLTQYGKGDMVFADAGGNLVAVEAKWIKEGPGKQTRSKRNKGRVTVRRQALRYAEALWTWVPWAVSVEARAWTNEDPAPELLGVFPDALAARGGDCQ